MTGLFITVEGPDGAGKSTQVESLKNYLEDAGYEVVLTREPGGTPLAESIRKILLDPENICIAPTTETLLYAAARAQHVADIIAPALSAGKIVLSDRFVDSSIVYQGAGRDLATDDIKSINKFATGGLEPHLTILLDLNPEQGLERLMRRCTSKADSLDRMEQESLEFYRKVRTGYLALAENEKRIKVVPAQGTVEDVSMKIVAIIDEFLIKSDKQFNISQQS